MSPFLSTDVFETEMSANSDDAPSPQDAISFLFLDESKHLQGHCNGSEQFQDWCSHDVSSRSGDVDMSVRMWALRHDRGGGGGMVCHFRNAGEWVRGD